MKTSKRKRHKPINNLIKFIYIIILLLFIWWFNNYTLKSTNIELTSKKIINPIKLAVIGDCHATKHGISNKTIIKHINKNEPDAVLIMGDMYSRNSSEELMQIPIDLTENIISEGYPVYFVTGDHDTNQSYIDAMQQTGAILMNYNSEIININGNNIQIMGIDNVYYSPTFNLNNEFSLNDNCYNILMAHIPNYEKFSSFGADLTVCADTHGGMVQLPFLGAMIDSSTMKLFPEIYGNTVYDKGLFDYNNGTMFITSGIGVSPAPHMRTLNKKEKI